MTQKYTFHKVQICHIELILAWRRQPHVFEWWGDDELLTEQDLDDDRVRRWIVSIDNQPFAYLQDYTVHGWDDHHFYHFPQGSRGIDQFIGVYDMMGIGHGSALIAQHVSALFRQGVPVVGTDPDPENLRAIAAYKKAGFKVFSEAQDTPWGRILPMKITG